MNFEILKMRKLNLLPWVRGVFNLNDPRWGRNDDASPPPSSGGRSDESDTKLPHEKEPKHPSRPHNQQPPDLDEVWRDLNKKLNAFFGGKSGGSGGGGFQPDMKNAGAGIGLIAVVLLIIWLGTGIFIVREGQQAVVTRFGKFEKIAYAGFNWRLPYPIERHESVFVTQIRSADVGRDTVIKSTGLRESAMLTEDENIVEIKFAVQYRLSDARAWLFESRNPEGAVIQAAETAVREVVGKMRMDIALAEERDQIAPRVRALMQQILDRYKVGVEVVAINLQQGGVRPPEQVQAAFDDVLKAGQERERVKNEAEAYANDVVPRAVGAASRLKEEADAYKAKIVAQAEGDAQRFLSLQAEYQKAPLVTRERLYIESMQQVYSSVTKVLIDSRQGGNLLYLPLDKLMQNTVAPPVAAENATVSAPATSTPAQSNNGALDTRSRDASRSRQRETR